MTPEEIDQKIRAFLDKDSPGYQNRMIDFVDILMKRPTSDKSVAALSSHIDKLLEEGPQVVGEVKP